MSKTPEEHFQERYKCHPAEATEEQRIAEWHRLKKVQMEKGFKPGWVGFAFKDLFGEWPPKGGYGSSQSAPRQQRSEPQQQSDPYGPPADPPPQGGFDYGPPPMDDDEPRVHCPHCGAAL